MIIETKEERAARGRPIGNAVPYQAMGGLTGFSSLADGYMRLDDSGIGVPSREFLEKPTGKSILGIDLNNPVHGVTMCINKVSDPLGSNVTANRNYVLNTKNMYHKPQQSKNLLEL